MGTLIRAALSTEPALNVSCSAVNVRWLSMYDACASSQVGVMVCWDIIFLCKKNNISFSNKAQKSFMQVQYFALYF